MTAPEVPVASGSPVTGPEVPVGPPSRRRVLAGLGTGALTGLGWALSAAGLASTASAAAHLPVTIRHQRSGEVFGRFELAPGTVLALSWIHSVDHTPWIEYYTLRADGFLLDCTDLALTGAGAPAEAPQVSRVGDMLRLCGLDRHFEAVRWIHSRAVEHTVRIAGRTVLSPTDLPHRQPIEMVTG